VARIILQRILWSPQLGYELVGVINGTNEEQEILSVPVLGTLTQASKILSGDFITQKSILMQGLFSKKMGKVLQKKQGWTIRMLMIQRILNYIGKAI
jgi:hypothetical protein